MKIKELTEDNNFDLAMNLRQSSDMDKQSQFAGKRTHRKPILTLRHINKLKKMKLARNNEHEKRKLLLNLMYSTPEEIQE